MPQKGNPNAKKIKSSDYIADLEKQIEQLQRQIKDAENINKELSSVDCINLMKQEDDFEKSLMDKYPSLFHKNEDGTPKYAECGIGCPEAWQEIVDNLCGSIVSYEKCRYRSMDNPDKKIRIWLFRNIWNPIWNPIYNLIVGLIDPYRPYRPKEKKRGFWSIPAEISALVKTTKRYKIDKWFKDFNYRKLTIKDIWVKKELPETKIAQVKTKFGGLRFYVDNADEHVYGMIQFAEYLCEQKNKKNG